MVSDPREQQAREAHRSVAGAEDQAARHRDRRDRLIVSLRTANPTYYTHTRLAQIVRCSPELIAHILRVARRTS